MNTRRGRHRPAHPRRTAALVAALAVTAVAVWFGADRLVVGSSTAAGAHPVRPAASVTAVSTPSAVATADTAATSASAAASTSAAASAAQTTLTALVAQASASGTSVAAWDVTTGVRTTAGATSGMTTASVVKLELLESLLLQHERAGTTLTDTETASVTAMIENSDNGAAEDVFRDIGGRSDVVSLEGALGLSTTTTVPGDDDYWGLTTTSADQQLVLLDNLVTADSPLDAASRSYALSLMRHVEADQTWGVPVAADSGTDPAVKNGWLGVDSDDGLWAVNSVGVITAGGDTVLVAVMTQHDSDYATGITRVQTLAKAAVAAVTTA